MKKLQGKAKYHRDSETAPHGQLRIVHNSKVLYIPLEKIDGWLGSIDYIAPDGYVQGFLNINSLLGEHCRLDKVVKKQVLIDKNEVHGKAPDIDPLGKE